jgi:hypothetical protein
MIDREEAILLPIFPIFFLKLLLFCLNSLFHSAFFRIYNFDSLHYEDAVFAWFVLPKR